MTASTADLAHAFHAAMLSGDEHALRSILAPDVTFTGPLAQATGIDACVAGMAEMARITGSDEVAVQLSDDANALLWSTLRPKGAPAVETATWLRIEAGRISAIRTLFDTAGISGRH
ncbi:nuclear transport factor 2 family protein [Streptomyces polyrhachis]|uniref:Nuclear transport factor 2 family protein n=1 Tax=Streptomyces polyrhachis TaxID=1282885 RepID=A0ABW2GPK0_9ACTN